MSVPAFNLAGVIPPYVGPHGPGDTSAFMSPHVTTPYAVAAALGTSDNRRAILKLWLSHRTKLRTLGFVRGFQWLDGSSVEDKEPNDLDVVSFLRNPANLSADQTGSLIQGNLALFERDQIRSDYRLDAFFIGLDGRPESIVALSSYCLNLFSNRRQDDMWKEMLQVDLGDQADDDVADLLIDVMSAPKGSGFEAQP